MLINYSCAQDLKPLDEEPNNSILKTELNYEMELVFEDENIIWGIEFLSYNSILASIKSGSIIHYKDGIKKDIKGVPEVYLRGQGGLLDLELHPNFNKNRLVYLSYAYMKNRDDGGNTAIARAQLVNDSLKNLEVLYKGSPVSRKGQHYGSRMAFDNENYLYFTIGDRGNRNVNPQDISVDGGKVYRINDDGTIPDDNPFIDVPNAKKRYILMDIEILKEYLNILKLEKFGLMNMDQEEVMK